MLLCVLYVFFFLVAFTTSSSFPLLNTLGSSFRCRAISKLIFSKKKIFLALLFSMCNDDGRMYWRELLIVKWMGEREGEGDGEGWTARVRGDKANTHTPNQIAKTENAMKKGYQILLRSRSNVFAYDKNFIIFYHPKYCCERTLAKWTQTIKMWIVFLCLRSFGSFGGHR